MQFIENGTSGSQNIIISQGSGANITIPAGDTKAVYLDGAGSGAAVVDAFASLSTVDLKVQDDLTVTDDASVGGDLLVSGEVQTANIGFTDGDNALTISDGGSVSFAAGVTLAGTTPTLTIGDAGAEDTKIVFDGNAQDFYIALDDSADDLIVGLGSTVGTTPIISLTEAGAVTLKNVGTGDDNPMSLTLQTSETDIAADDVLGKISFQAPDEGTGTDAILVAAAMQAISEGDFSASSNATSLAFMTGASEAATTKMTVTSGGHVGIGMTPAPVGSDTVLSIYNSATPRIKLHNSTTGSASGDGAEINMSSSDLIIENREAGNQRFFTNGSERLRIDSSGRILIGTTSSSGSSIRLEAHDATNPIIQVKDTTSNIICGIQAGNAEAVIRCPQDSPLVFNVGASETERMRIDSSGNVGIGSTSITNILELKKSSATGYDASAKQDGGARLSIFNSNNTTSDTFADIHFQCHSTSPGEARIGMRLPSVGNSELFFITEGSGTLAERMRIDNGGSLLVGTTSKASACSITAPASPTVPALLTSNTTTGATHYAAFFRNSGGTEIGFIKISNTGTTYDTGSDYRLKENAQPIQNGLERLNQLNPVKFDWKEDGTSSEGFIAHEVQEIFPDAVSGVKDAETMQGMDLWKNYTITS